MPCASALRGQRLASVDLAYTRYINSGTQEAVVRRFLPLEVEADEDAGQSTGPSADLEYEPSPSGILDEILPRYVESRIFSALLDASASEHAARQRAMKAATDNAEELQDQADPHHEPARQDSITTEIMEIVSGAEALKGDKGGPEDLLLEHLVPATPSPSSSTPTTTPARGTDRRPPNLACTRRTQMTVTENPTSAPSGTPALKEGRAVAIAGPVVDVEFPVARRPRSTPRSRGRSASTAPTCSSPVRSPSRSATAGSALWPPSPPTA